MVNEKIMEKGYSRAKAMNARLVGSGTKAMVLSHGYGGDQSVWDKILPYLAQRYLVLVFDWNFSGSVRNDDEQEENKKKQGVDEEVRYSCYEDFAQELIHLVDEMDLKKPMVFVGHSMSAMIGCIASIKKPLLFTNLILIGPSPRYINCEGYEGGFDRPGIEQIFSNIESNFQSWTSYFASLVVDPIDPNSVQKFQNSLQKMKPNVALALAKIVFLSDKRELLENVMVPCTLIHTKNDIVVPDSVIEFMRNKIKGKTVVEIVETQGHFPQLTAPDHLLKVIGRVLGF